MQRAITR